MIAKLIGVSIRVGKGWSNRMAEKLNICRLKFLAGAAPGSQQLEIAVPNVTVLVGPNNSGKSLTLREVESICLGSNVAKKIVQAVDFEWPDTVDEFMSMLRIHEASPPDGQVTQPEHLWVARPMIRSGEKELHQQLHEGNLKAIYENRNLVELCSIFVRLFTLRLDGRTRFDLVDPKSTGPLEAAPKNHLWALFVNDDGRERVRKFTEEAFGKHYVIDPTAMQSFRVRLSDTPPSSKQVEQGLDQQARDFHKAAPLVAELGDGVRTSVGLVSAVMSLTHKILLIDEPEAFLHPTLARRVGKVLSSTARERGASMIVATHSPEFLMGCIQTAPDLRIVRLTYSKDQSTARTIEPAEITTLMQNPLLRSANALRALFHRGVVISEADADRAFYEETNMRLMESGRGIDGALFLNAQNWQTVPKIAYPLRKLGIPAAAVVDFDVLGSDSLGDLWDLVSDTDRNRLQSEFGILSPKIKAIAKADLKTNGLTALPANDQAGVGSFVNSLAEHGIFVVPVGELECWLASLGVQRSNNKPRWLIDMFQRLGDDPTNNNYVAAGTDDVWRFLADIESWIDRPDRKGIPI